MKINILYDLLSRLPIMKIFIWAICVLSVSTVSFSTHAQIISRPTAAQLDSFRMVRVAEKLFIHTDQTTYLTGETLWMSAYLVDASWHLPAHLSKVAYVELLSDSGKPALQAKVALQAGRGNGAMFLPASLASGHYLLRAYTRWMRNGEAAFFMNNRSPSSTRSRHSKPQLPPQNPIGTFGFSPRADSGSWAARAVWGSKCSILRAKAPS